ncbi:MAG: hypothetical protein NTX56_13530 [Proteobacteria bacterium]|nr:hypothetical protein [Pseudomonadota bacterium]
MTRRKNSPPVTVDGATGKPITGTPRIQPIRLDTLRGIQRELASLYRAARYGRVSTADASRLAYVLDRLARLQEIQTFEARLAALENQEHQLI